MARANDSRHIETDAVSLEFVARHPVSYLCMILSSASRSRLQWTFELTLGLCLAGCSMDVNYLRAGPIVGESGGAGGGAGTSGTSSGGGFGGTQAGTGGTADMDGSMLDGSMPDGSMPDGSDGSLPDGGRDSGTVFNNHCLSYPQKLPFKVDSVYKAFQGCQNPGCSQNISPYFAPVQNPDCDQAIPPTGLDPPPFGPDAGTPSTQGSGEGGVDGGPSCFEFLYNPNCTVMPCWAGVIFAQSPYGGTDPGICVEPGAREISFSARASHPNARIKVGMVGALAITMAATEAYLNIGTEWAVYRIPMPAGLDYDQFSAAQNGVWNFFSVILEPEFHPGGVYVFFKDMTWNN